MERYDVSVVIPCLNEEKTIGICVSKVLKVFKENNIHGELIISDNGSTDRSLDFAQDAAGKDEKGNSLIKIVHCSKKGYGNALLFGFAHANGKYVVMGDADNTYNFMEIPMLYNKALEDSDIDMVMGSRFRGGIEKNAMPFLHQYLGNPGLTFIIDVLFGCGITDSQCGLRLFKKSAFDKINFKATGMEFATEIIVEFSKHGFKIAEVPVTLSKGPEDRKPHLNTFRDGFRILCFILKKRFNII